MHWYRLTLSLVAGIAVAVATLLLARKLGKDLETRAVKIFSEAIQLAKGLQAIAGSG